MLKTQNKIRTNEEVNSKFDDDVRLKYVFTTVWTCNLKNSSFKCGGFFMTLAKKNKKTLQLLEISYQNTAISLWFSQETGSYKCNKVDNFSLILQKWS